MGMETANIKLCQGYSKNQTRILLHKKKIVLGLNSQEIVRWKRVLLLVFKPETTVTKSDTVSTTYRMLSETINIGQPKRNGAIGCNWKAQKKQLPRASTRGSLLF